MKILLLILIGVTSLSYGQLFDPGEQQALDDIKPQDVVHWLGPKGLISSDKKTVKVQVRLETSQGFTLYTDKLTFFSPGMIVSSVSGPETRRQFDAITGEEVDVYGQGFFDLIFVTDTPYEKESFPLEITYTGCTEKICLFPYTERLDFPVYPDSAAPAATDPGYIIDSQTSPPQGSDDDLEQMLAEGLKSGQYSFFMLLGVLFLGGLLTNLTPCVYPMIPITLRLLASQGMHPVASGALYAGGIMLTYTGLGVFASLSGGVFGSLLASDGFNLTFALIMSLLGVSMLGFGNFHALQSLGNKLGSGKQSPTNTLLMGAGAGLVASPCTGPVLAALLAYTAKIQSPGKGAFLLMVYSIGFALPYVFLGGAASALTRTKVSPKVQIGTKIFFAAVMFALSLYYLQTPLGEWMKALNGHWLTIGLAGGLAGLALMGYWLVNPSLYMSKHMLLVPSLVISTGVFGLFQASTGADLVTPESLKWVKSDAAGRTEALALNRPILIDGWADWCAACKKMDATTFRDPEILRELENHWIAVKLDMTEMTDENEKLAQKYRMQGLPTLVLLPPDGDVGRMKTLGGYSSKERLLKELQSFRMGR